MDKIKQTFKINEGRGKTFQLQNVNKETNKNTYKSFSSEGRFWNKHVFFPWQYQKIQRNLVLTAWMKFVMSTATAVS